MGLFNDNNKNKQKKVSFLDNCLEYLIDKDQFDESEDEMTDLEKWQKDLVDTGEYDSFNFEEEELEEDDYYYDDDE